MPMTRLIPRNPWNLSFVWGMVLGVCLFQSLGAPKAFADDLSPLFAKDTPAQSNSAPASQPTALPEETANAAPNIWSTLFHLVLALAITVGLIVLTVWGLKWVWEKRGWYQPAEESKSVRILSSTYLAPRKAIYLVEVGKKILVVGAGNEEMTCLDVIRDPEEVEALRNTTQQGFPKMFNRILQRNETARQAEETQKIFVESTQAVGGYVQKLKNMKKKKNNPESLEEKNEP